MIPDNEDLGLEEAEDFTWVTEDFQSPPRKTVDEIDPAELALELDEEEPDGNRN